MIRYFYWLQLDKERMVCVYVFFKVDCVDIFLSLDFIRDGAAF